MENEARLSVNILYCRQYNSWLEIVRLHSFYMKLGEIGIMLHVIYQWRRLSLNLLNTNTRDDIRAASGEKVPSNMRKMRTSRSSYECAKYHPGISSPFLYFVVSNDSVSGQRRPWSYCADAQADLRPRCPHMPEGTLFSWRIHFWIVWAKCTWSDETAQAQSCLSMRTAYDRTHILPWCSSLLSHCKRDT